MNKRRHTKSFPLAATVIIIAVAICGVSFAVKALMVKYQVIQGGDKLKQIERELVELNTKNEALQNRKEMLISATKLQDSIKNGILRLEPITANDVIMVGRPAKPDLAVTTSASREEGR